MGVEGKGEKPTQTGWLESFEGSIGLRERESEMGNVVLYSYPDNEHTALSVTSACSFFGLLAPC